jgi:hypothetical protein
MKPFTGGNAIPQYVGMKLERGSSRSRNSTIDDRQSKINQAHNERSQRQKKKLFGQSKETSGVPSRGQSILKSGTVEGHHSVWNERETCSEIHQPI